MSNMPHHVTQRVNCSQRVFFNNIDKEHYLKPLHKLSNNFMLSEIRDWSAYIAEEDKQIDRKLFKKSAKIGRSLGDKDFIVKLENTTWKISKKEKTRTMEEGISVVFP